MRRLAAAADGMVGKDGIDGMVSLGLKVCIWTLSFSKVVPIFMGTLSSYVGMFARNHDAAIHRSRAKMITWYGDVMRGKREIIM